MICYTYTSYSFGVKVKMKVKYNLSNNFFKYFNEANGIIFLKKKLLKNKRTKIESYLSIISKNAVIISIITTITYLLTSSSLIKHIITILFLINLVLYIFILFDLYFCFKSNSNNHDGILTINKNGITDEGSNGNKVEITYQNIELIVITKNIIIFIANSPIAIFINNKNKDKIIKEIKKYSDVLIIDKDK